MVTFMETQRIKLTPPSLEYSESMFTVIEDSKEEFAPFLPWVTDSLTLTDIEENTKTALVNFELFVDEFWFNIIEKATGHFIGAIGFIVRDKSVPYFEIGYWLRTSETGKGYVTEAVSLVERYAFQVRCARRLEIKMAESNIKSQAVATRCGYHFEACLVNGRRLPSGDLDNTLIYVKTQL